MARTGAVVALLALALVLVASTTAMASPSCCSDNRIWGVEEPHHTGCSPDQSGSCNEWCQASCRGGECKFRGGQHVCHCYC
ncbi:hypothetical protein EJB05_42450, partial [Eragrostis curvula]